MKKLSFFYVTYNDGRVVRYSNLILPLIMLNPNVKLIKSESGDVVWEPSMKKPTN